MTRRAAVIPLVLAALVVTAAPARAADYFVNSTADDGEGTCNPAGCTLREAVMNAGPADIVRVPANVYGLSNGPLPLTGDTIIGAGARTTIIDGLGTSKVLYATQGANQVTGITVRGGNGVAIQAPAAGGGILVAGATTAAALTLTDSVVTANRSTAGGGIASLNATLTLVGTTVAGNVATTGAGSVGGGIAVSGGTTTLRNSTVSGNSAIDSDGSRSQGGGIYVEAGSLVTQSVTIAGGRADVGGGLYRATGTAATISHTIIADSVLGGACGGALTPVTADHDIADDATCGFAGSPQDPLLAPVANNGGPTDTHALPVTSPAIDGGTSCPSTDQRGLARQGACDIGAFEYVPPPPPGPPQPSPQELPPPVAGKSVNALFKSGKVKIKLPRTRSFVALTEDRQIPVGTIVDTLQGRVTIVAAADKKGGTATADFYGGIFKLGQTNSAAPITTLKLVEKLSCKKSGKASAAAKKKKKRRLWGDGTGKFRTEGSYSSATVRGTKWLVQDNCTSTLTRVVRGRVSVRDFVRKKAVIVRAGKKYVARAKR